MAKAILGAFWAIGVYKESQSRPAPGLQNPRQFARGAPPVNDKPGAARGGSEVTTFRLAKDRMMLAAIEPWHGHQLVVYSTETASWTWWLSGAARTSWSGTRTARRRQPSRRSESLRKGLC